MQILPTSTIKKHIENSEEMHGDVVKYPYLCYRHLTEETRSWTLREIHMLQEQRKQLLHLENEV